MIDEWQLSPVSDALVLLTAVGYLSAVRRRARRGEPTWPRRRTTAFLCGLLVIVVALDSAVGIRSPEHAPIHMVQHLALITVAPVLVALGHPLTLTLESSSHGRETVELLRHNRFVGGLTHPLFAAGPYTATLVGTHLADFIELMTNFPWLHRLEEVMYLASGYLFAVSLLAREPLRRRPPYVVRFGLVLLAMTVDTSIGIVLMVIPGPADRQPAGALMCFGGDGLMMVVALVIVAQWVADSDHSHDVTAAWRTPPPADTSGREPNAMKAVICGAGIAGLAIANRLPAAGWKVTLLEQAPTSSALVTTRRSGWASFRLWRPAVTASTSCGTTPAPAGQRRG